MQIWLGAQQTVALSANNTNVSAIQLCQQDNECIVQENKKNQRNDKKLSNSFDRSCYAIWIETVSEHRQSKQQRCVCSANLYMTHRL